MKDDNFFEEFNFKYDKKTNKIFQKMKYSMKSRKKKKIS